MSIANEIQRLQSAKANIKAAIENKGVTVGDGTIDTYAEMKDEISAGGSGEDYLQYAKTVQFHSLNDFGKAEVELNLNKCTSLLNLCFVNTIENTNNTVEHITINIPKETATTITNASDMLGCAYSCRDTVLKKVTFNFPTKSIQNFSNVFGCLTAVEEIDGIPLDFSSATTMVNPFNYHQSLKEVRFVEMSIPLSISFRYSSQLSDESIQSIIDGLADLTGNTAQTLTLHATVGGKLTETQKATITAKNWELVY